MDLFWIIIGAVMLVLLVVFLYSKKKSSKSESKEEKGEPEIEQPESDLLKLNLKLRKSAIDSSVTKKCEEVIDQLVDLIPAINTAAMPGTEMAWTVNQIAREYLPNKCMGPYLNLNLEARNEPQKIEMVLSNLAALSQELEDVKSLLNNRDENEFNKKATFLKHRFNQNGEE